VPLLPSEVLDPSEGIPVNSSLVMKQLIYIAAGVLLVGPILLLAGLSLLSRKPANLGITVERLADCPSSPNCVSSLSSVPAQRIDPLSFQDAPEEAMRRLETVLAGVSGVTIISRAEDYIHAEAKSMVFRFIDDLEFLLSRENGVIHVRSASRVGYSDFGVNRKRMEGIRGQFSSAREPVIGRSLVIH
jgi:uncharacterized protein (DUF1499 family)